MRAQKNKKRLLIHHMLKDDFHNFFGSLGFILFIFKYKFIYFYWRLITLQYCIGFAIHQHESYMIFITLKSDAGDNLRKENDRMSTNVMI